MVAVENRQAQTPEHAGRSRASPALLVLLAVVAGYALTVVVFYPGYVTVDAGYVYADAKTWQLGDWQSPAMAALWRLIDPLAPGGLSMFLLTVTLYWLGFGLLALIAARRSALLGLVTPLIALAPPAFLFLGLICGEILWLPRRRNDGGASAMSGVTRPS